MSTTITTASGRTKTLPPNLEPERVVGLDPVGRFVVNDFGESPDFVFGLTLCCNAYDKGVDDGVVCRGCYSYEEVGVYIFRDENGEYPGLDPVVRDEEER